MQSPNIENNDTLLERYPVQINFRNGAWGNRTLREIKVLPKIENAFFIEQSSINTKTLFMGKLMQNIPQNFIWNADTDEISDSVIAETRISRATAPRIEAARGVVQAHNTRNQIRMGSHETTYLATKLARRGEHAAAEVLEECSRNPDNIGSQLNYLDRQEDQLCTPSANIELTTDSMRTVEIEINGTILPMRINIVTLREALGLPPYELYRNGTFNYQVQLASPAANMEDINHMEQEELI
ncbi:hypothetical protein HK103_003542 [Boothiomyces macroporosus]|uniref:Uncharacterized protein n=1 Tax=Boothiomyces macroporosus TaxID=261099 RepID=A0AAD5U9N6_9FUNG|nr:hypothetical protein HK103_003542 [Boothiomyces macroporosus]